MLKEQNQNTKTLIFLLAYNEANAINEVLAEIKNEVDKWKNKNVKIIVIDDGSVDSTSMLVKKAGIKVISHPVNLGIGAGEQTALIYARKYGFNIVIRVDADGQHPASEIKKIYDKIANGSADLCIGSRFVGGKNNGFRSTLIRRAGIKYFSFLCRTIGGVRIKDPTSGFRGFGPRALNLFTENPAPDYPEVDAIIEGARAGLKIEEVRVSFRKRKAGRSTINLKNSVYYAIKVSLSVLISALRQKPELNERKAKE